MSEDSNWHNFLSEFRSLTSSLSSRLQSINKSSILSEQQNYLHEAQQTAGDIDQLIEGIEPQIKHFNYNLKQKANQQLNECKSQFESLNRTTQLYAQSIKQGKLIINSNNGVNSTNNGNVIIDVEVKYKQQRELLLGSHATISEGNTSLDNTQRILAETTEVGTHTTMQLVKQREQFLNQREMLHETDTILGRSKATLRRMQRRIVTNKLISGAIILGEMGLFALIVYLKYYN